MLAGDRCEAWKGISGADAVGVAMQTSQPVDYVVVALRSGSSVFIAANDRSGSISLTEQSPAFVETITATVRQFLSISRALTDGSRILWVVPSSAGNALTRHLMEALDTHREDDSESLHDSLSNRSARERKVLEPLLQQARSAWTKHTSTPPDDAELRSYLRLLHIDVCDFESGHQDDREAQTLIRTHSVSSPAQARDAWEKLETIFNRADQRGLCRTAPALRKQLADAGFDLRPPETYSRDISLAQLAY
jgi:hypothetical protein